MIRNMMSTPTEALGKNRELGISPTPGMTDQDAGAILLTDEMDHAVKVLAGKLAKAIYFLESGNIFSINGPHEDAMVYQYRPTSCGEI